MRVPCHRVFGGPGEGDFASPAALAAGLQKQKLLNQRLVAELQAAREHGAMAERRCLDILAQHHRVHAAERQRETMRHAQDEARLRDLHAASLRSLSAKAPTMYGAAAEDAAEAASKAMLRAAGQSKKAAAVAIQ